MVLVLQEIQFCGIIGFGPSVFYLKSLANRNSGRTSDVVLGAIKPVLLFSTKSNAWQIGLVKEQYSGWRSERTQESNSCQFLNEIYVRSLTGNSPEKSVSPVPIDQISSSQG